MNWLRKVKVSILQSTIFKKQIKTQLLQLYLLQGPQANLKVYYFPIKISYQTLQVFNFEDSLSQIKT